MPPILLTAIAMLAFAANSLLCRAALLSDSIDPGSFTIIRLVSGAVTLLAIHVIARSPRLSLYQSTFIIKAGLALFVYALSFSYAYINIAAGTGALILFGVVQLTMIAFYLLQGHTLNRFEKIGIGTALAGFTALMLPSAESPDLGASLLMLVSGVSWAVFTLLGKQVESPRVGITQGFIGASILALMTSPWLITFDSITTDGAMWATLSGVFASAAGYVIWYYVVAKLNVLQASIAQLSVPMIALWLGSIWLNETISLYLVTISCVILGGIALIFIAKKAV